VVVSDVVGVLLRTGVRVGFVIRVGIVVRVGGRVFVGVRVGRTSDVAVSVLVGTGLFDVGVYGGGFSGRSQLMLHWAVVLPSRPQLKR